VFRCAGERVSFCRRSRVSSVSCEARVAEVVQSENPSLADKDRQFSCVMKFGGSSVASAERMREVAELILSFPEECPIVVLSAMGKTTNKLLNVHFHYLSLCSILF
jgi:aspartate kinase